MTYYVEPQKPKGRKPRGSYEHLNLRAELTKLGYGGQSFQDEQEAKDFAKLASAMTQIPCEVTEQPIHVFIKHGVSPFTDYDLGEE